MTYAEVAYRVGYSRAKDAYTPPVAALDNCLLWIEDALSFTSGNDPVLRDDVAALRAYLAKVKELESGT